MIDYYFYRADGIDTLRKTWTHRPTIKEIDEEVKKLAAECGIEKIPYTRIWGGGANEEYTMYDFGSWSVFGKVKPSVFNMYIEGDDNGERCCEELNA